MLRFFNDLLHKRPRGWIPADLYVRICFRVPGTILGKIAQTNPPIRQSLVDLGMPIPILLIRDMNIAIKTYCLAYFTTLKAWMPFGKAPSTVRGRIQALSEEVDPTRSENLEIFHENLIFSISNVLQ